MSLHIITQTFNHRNKYGYAHNFTVFYGTANRTPIIVADDCSIGNAQMICYNIFDSFENSLHLESSTRLAKEHKQLRLIYKPQFHKTAYIIEFLHTYIKLCEPILHIPS